MLIVCSCFLPSLLTVSGACLWGWGGEMNLFPVERGQGWGLEALRLCNPGGFQSHVVLSCPRKGWAGGLWLGSPGVGALAQGQGTAGAAPLDRSQTAPPGAPSLCTNSAREMPPDTLRKVGGSWPDRTGRGWGGGGLVPAAGARNVHAWTLVVTAAGPGGTGEGQSPAAEEPERLQVPRGSLPQFPARRQRGRELPARPRA